MDLDRDKTPAVLVVGAGPVGLVMAAELSRHGIPCRIVDQGEGASSKSKAVSVHARTLEIFESMGVIEEALRRGRRLVGLSWHSGTRRVAHITFEGMDTPYSFELGIAQGDTEHMLAEHLLRLGIPVERRVRFEGLEQDADGVTARLRRGDGAQETLRIPWLVACDGARSEVRHVLGFPFKGTTYEEQGLHADVRLTWPAHFQAPADQNIFFLGPPGFMAALPLAADGHYRLVFLLRPGDGISREATLENLQAQAAARGPAGVTVRDPAWIDTFRMHCRMVDRYRSGRVFLAGDAAHVHSPFGGQGISLGIQDAYNLAWKLALVIRGVGRPELLDSYDAERRPLASETLRSTHATTLAIRTLSALRHPLGCALRDGAISFITSRPQLKRRAGPALGMLTRNYRGSSLCAEDWPASRGTPGLAAGDRAPDTAPLSRGPRHTLLLFTEGRLVDLADEIGQRHGDVVEPVLVVPTAERPAALSGTPHRVVLDADRALHRRYGARSECLYLIRPDGYIAYRNLPADRGKLRGYLRRVFLT